MISAQVFLFALLVVVDVALWVAAVTAPLGTTGRFRAVAAATLLLAVLCGNLIGWPRTAAVGAVAMWLAAIVAGMLGASPAAGANRAA